MNLSDIAKLIEQSMNGQEVTEADVVKAIQKYLEENDPDTSVLRMYSLSEVMRYVDEYECSREEAAKLTSDIEADWSAEEEAHSLIPEYVYYEIDRLQKQDGRNRKAYSEDELIPLTYAVLFNEEDLGGRNAIVSNMKRREESIVFKMRQIASILDHRKIDRNQAIEPIEILGYNGRTAERDWGEAYLRRYDIYDLTETISEIIKNSKDEMREKALGVLRPDKSG